MSSRVVCKKFDIFYASKIRLDVSTKGCEDLGYEIMFSTSWDILELGTVQEQDISSH